MPDGNIGGSILLAKHQQALKRLELLLKQECVISPIRLNARQVGKYKDRGAIAGWAIQPPDMHYRLHIFVDARYPFSVPKIAIFPELPPVTYPHIEEDGYLCLSEVAVPKSEEDVEKVAHYIIAEAVDLIKKCLSGDNEEEFKDEILSYWDRKKTKEASNCFSLLDLEGNKSARIVKIWNGIGEKDAIFIADSQQAGEKWLDQKIVNKNKKKWKCEDALFAWSDKILMPHEYPSNNQQLSYLLKHHCGPQAYNNFQKIVASTPNKIGVILGFETKFGKALVFVEIEKPKIRSSYHMTAEQELNRGFRLKYLPPGIAGKRYSSPKTTAKRFNIQRVDPSWILSRDSDQKILNLKNKTVTLVGCGSIGSELIRMLAQNGIQNVNLIDPDTMGWENIGRHVLGANATSFSGVYSKVNFLSGILKSQFPHINIKSIHAKKWEEVIKTDITPFYDADLIIMATGDWPAENAMNQYALSDDNFPAILYGWAEAYAVAGHSFLTVKDHGCFNCAFKDASFRFKISEFETEHRLLPTCGTTFQPFRSIELAPINAMIAAHAIEYLVDKIHFSQIRSWIGSKNILIENSGKWTPLAEYNIQAKGLLTGQFMIQNNLDKLQRCTLCKKEEEACSIPMKKI